MAAVVPLIAGALAPAGAAFLGGSVAAGASTAALASTALSAGSTLLSGFSAMRQANYQAAVIAQQIEQEKKNAVNLNQATQIEAQEADEQASQFLSSEIARQGASGFALSSPSFLSRNSRNRATAAVNRLRITEDGARQVENTQNRIAGLEAERRGARSNRFSALIQTGIGLTNDWLQGANLVSNASARRINTTASGVRT